MVVAAGLAVGSLVLASGGPWGDGWDGGWLLARIALTLLWIFLVFTIIRFVIFGRFGRWGGRGRGGWGPSPLERARGVLAERYARGEIDAEEYRARSETLKES